MMVVIMVPTSGCGVGCVISDGLRWAVPCANLKPQVLSKTASFQLSEPASCA